MGQIDPAGSLELFDQVGTVAGKFCNADGYNKKTFHGVINRLHPKIDYFPQYTNSLKTRFQGKKFNPGIASVAAHLCLYSLKLTGR